MENILSILMGDDSILKLELSKAKTYYSIHRLKKVLLIELWSISRIEPKLSMIIIHVGRKQLIVII